MSMPMPGIDRDKRASGNSHRCVIAFLCVASVMGLAVGLGAEHQARLKLQGEHDALERQLDHMAGLIADTEQLSNALARSSLAQSETNVPSQELLRLRGQVGVLRLQTGELESVRRENRQVRASLESSLKIESSYAPADYWPRDSWTFTGYASPEAALQTSIWAANNGDLKTLLASGTGEFRQSIERDLKDKSESEASIRAMDEVSGLKSVRVLNRDFQGDDTAVLTAAFEDGTNIHIVNLLMNKIGNDWKLSSSTE